MATLGLMLCCLEFLIILSFTLCFVNEIQWVMEHAHKQRYRRHKYLLIIDAPLHMASVMPISKEFQETHDVWEFNSTQSKYKVSTLNL